MPVKKSKVVEEYINEEPEPLTHSPREPIIKKERKKLTPEALEKLQSARVLALEKRRALKTVKDVKKEMDFKPDSKLDEIETYKRVKDKVDNELKTNEIVGINERMNKMMEQFNNIDGKLSGYIDERKMRKEAKQKQQVINQLPNMVSKNMLEEELKRVELERFRKSVFGW